MLNAQPTRTSTKEKQHKDLNAFLREVMEPIDQRELGLINRATYEQMCNNPIINVPTATQLVNELSTPKAYLEAIVQDANEFGIEYAGSLTAEEEVTDAELARALDTDDLNSIKEGQTPELQRKNFRYIDKQRNENDGYTRYLLANGNDRIIYDDELVNNPRLKQKVELSNAREDGDREKYNEIKLEQQANKMRYFNSTNTADEFVQCFLKVGSKLYGDAIDLPSNLVKMMREDRKISKQNGFTHTNERVNRSQYKLISYLDMFKSPVKNLLKTCGEIKIVDQTKKTLAILSNNKFIANKI